MNEQQRVPSAGSPSADLPGSAERRGTYLRRNVKKSATATVAGLTVIGSIVFVMPAATGLTAAAPTLTTPASVSSSLEGDVEAAKRKLKEATRAVDAAEKRVDDTEAKLPAANEQLAKAEAALAEANAAADRAAAAVAQAQEQVKTQKAHVDEARTRMDELKNRIAAIARQNYINGQESIELSLLLDARDATDFAAQMEGIRRAARGNDQIFVQLTRLQEELAARLAELKAFEDEAERQEAIVSQKRNEAANARDKAAAAKTEIARLVAASKAALDESLRLRADVKKQYEALQEKLMAASGVAAAKGTGRTAREALAWALKWVGGGSHYDGLCLGFVDDAYDPQGSRMPTAIAQWYRAKKAGVAHPGDRTPPVGAQMFWWSPNSARHIAMYAGGGMVITTGAFGGRVGLRTVEDMDGWGPYLGWAEAYYD